MRYVLATILVVLCAALAPAATVSVHAWLDANRNSELDQSESALADLPFFAWANLESLTMPGLAWSGPVILGHFQVHDLMFGQYRLTMTRDPSYGFVVGGDSAVDINGCLVFEVGVELVEVKVGYADRRGTISGNTWLDRNRNGEHDPAMEMFGDMPFPVTATLEPLGQPMMAQSVPVSMGRYQFSGIIPGTYRVRLSGDPAYGFVVGGGSQVDAAGVSAELVVDDNEQVVNVGYADRRGTISGSTWLDRNRNGERDPAMEMFGDMPFPVTATLEPVNLPMMIQSVPVTMGRFEFTNVFPGNYRVRLSGDPAFAFVVGASSQVGIDGVSAELTVDGNEQVVGVGYVDRRGTISGGTWLDRNRNGERDPAEEMFGDLPFLEMAWLESVNQPLMTQIAPVSMGRYQFTNVFPGTYRVHLRGDPLFKFVVGADSQVDASGVSAELVVDGNEQVVDVGYADRRGTIGGSTWLDRNHDGQRDPAVELFGDMPFPVTATLEQVNMPTMTLSVPVTMGRYEFTNIFPGSYRVRLTGDQGYTFVVGGDSDVDVTGASADLLVDGNVLTIDVGYSTPVVLPPVVLSGDLWCDLNNNGMREANESGFLHPDLRIRVLRADGAVVEYASLSRGIGHWRSSDLPAGSYYIEAETDAWHPLVVQSAASGVDQVTGRSAVLSTSSTIDIGRREIAPAPSVTPNGITTAAATVTMTINFPYDVSGFEADDLSVVNGSIGAVQWAGTNAWSVPVAPAGGGLVTVNIRAGAVTTGLGSASLAGQTSFISSLPPVNDNFAKALPLTGTVGTLVALNTKATREANEPYHANTVGGASVWWTMTPVKSGRVTIDTTGTQFNTILGVHTGTAVGSLTKIVANNDISGTVLQSRLDFVAAAGTTYRIAVDGVTGAAGPLTLNWYQVVNDDFNAPIVLTGLQGQLTATNVGATNQSKEPAHAGFVPYRSVWFSFTPTTNGILTVNTAGSTFDTVLADYKGTLGSLTPVWSNNNVDGTLQSRIQHSVKAGSTYRIVVDGVGGASGVIRLNWTMAPAGAG